MKTLNRNVKQVEVAVILSSSFRRQVKSIGGKKLHIWCNWTITDNITLCIGWCTWTIANNITMCNGWCAWTIADNITLCIGWTTADNHCALIGTNIIKSSQIVNLLGYSQALRWNKKCGSCIKCRSG